MSEIRSQSAPARDELAETVFDLLTRVAEVGTSDRNVIAHGIAMGLEYAGWSKPRTVNSAAEAETLAEGSVIRTGGMASIALTDVNQPVRVWDAGHGAQCTTDRLTFPVTVLFTPGEAG